MARIQAGLWAGGALLCSLITVLPHPEEAFEPAFYAVTAVAALMAAALRLGAGRIPLLALQLGVGLGTVLISVCILFSGEREGAPASDIEMLYIWIALYSAYFFSARAALLHIGWIAAAYGVVLLLSSDPSLIGVRWFQTVGTLALAAAVIQTLRRRIALLLERLSQAALSDPLTGLRNRRGFEERFVAEVGRARRSGSALSVLVGDLDHFKLVNDRLGHPAGDAALVRTGDLLREAVRDADLVARTGGEEFALILPDTRQAGAYMLAERLRAKVERAFAGEAVPVTISFGLAAFPNHGDSGEELAAAADRALYAAKELGRNRTVMFSEEIGAISAEDPLTAHP